MDTANELTPGQDTLTQSQVEQVLAEVGHETEAAPKPANPVKPFRQSDFLAENELRKLRGRQEGFIRALAARLSLYLRLEFGLQAAGMRAVSFQHFIERMLTPTHLTLFKLEPLRGICFLDIPPRLGLTIADRLLGGAAHSADPKAELSEIEIALLDQAVQIILTEWCAQWSDLQELKPALLGHEMDGRFLQTSARNNLIFEVSLEASLGDCKEKFRIGLPYRSLEPLLRQMSGSMEAQTKETPAPAAPVPRWNQVFDDVPVAITAELRGLELTARALTTLKPGDTLPLQPQHLTQVRLRLAQTPTFLGNLGTLSQKWAIEVTQILKD